VELDEGVCAACGKPLGIRANWHLANEGRAYHNDCVPSESLGGEASANVESLGDFAERKARRVLHGAGARTLDDDVAGG
jgi:hypothetical protein